MRARDSFELEMVSVRLVKEGSLLSQTPVTDPESAVRVLGALLMEADREMLCVVNLKATGVPINATIVSMGTIMGTLAAPREMLKASILSNAASMMLMHNHPGGSLEPSEQDVALTGRMVRICDLIDIPLLDHVIVGQNLDRYFSFREAGIVSELSYKYKPVKDYREIRFSDSKVAEENRRKGQRKENRQEGREC